MKGINEFNAFKNDLMKLFYSNYFKYFFIKKEENNNNKLVIKQKKIETGIIFDINDNNDIIKEFAEEDEKIIISNEIKLMV